MIREHPATVALGARYELLLARIDAGVDPRLASRAGLIASVGLHTLILLTLIAAWLLTSSGGGTKSASTVAVDLVSIESTRDARAQGREQQARAPSEVSLTERIEATPPAFEPIEVHLASAKPDEAAKVQASPSSAAEDVDSASARLQQAGSGNPGALVAGKTGAPGTPGATPGPTAEDSLRDQMARCWNARTAFANTHVTAVTFELSLSQDGSIARPPRLSFASSTAVTLDPSVRQAADTAVRAIYVCAPYRVPTSGETGIRDMSVTFATLGG